MCFLYETELFVLPIIGLHIKVYFKNIQKALFYREKKIQNPKKCLIMFLDGLVIICSINMKKKWYF